MTCYTIDATTERLIDLRGVCAWMEKRGARRPHINGVRRWFRRPGVRGVVIPSVMVGGIRYTSEGALLWWIAATSQAAASGGTATTAAPAGNVTPHERRVLERAGVLDREGA